jgi:Magnesium chelatase, subunit ChlI
VPLPGEGSLAHHGMRFVDALPECRRDVLEGLRPPREMRLSRHLYRPSCRYGILSTDGHLVPRPGRNP